MALSTFAELKTAIATTLIRDDVSDDAERWIRLAEAQMQRDIRHWRMEKRATATIDARFSAVPSDFLAPIRINITATSYMAPMEWVSAESMQEDRSRAKDAAGVPCAYAIVGGEFEFFPTPDDEYTAELFYRRTIPALSDSNTTNWLLDLAPDAYLYGALLHSAPLLQEDARLQTWAGLYSNAIAAVNLEGKRGKSGGAKKMRLDFTT